MAAMMATCFQGGGGAGSPPTIISTTIVINIIQSSGRRLSASGFDKIDLPTLTKNISV